MNNIKLFFMNRPTLTTKIYLNFQNENHKKLIINIFFLAIFINLSFQLKEENIINNNNNENSLKIKRMIVIIFPGGISHNYIFQNLFDYSISHENIFKYEYHIVSHKIDSKIWEEKIQNKSSSYKLFTYGNASSYKKAFEEAVEIMNNNPIFGFSGFNKAMILNIRHFMESDILQTFKMKQNEYKKKYNEDYYDMITTDIPNFIHKLIYQELNIKLCLYLLPSLVPQILYPNFEMNPSYMPVIGSIYSDEMTFIERINNSFIQTFNKFIFYIYRMLQSQLINSYGFDINNNLHINNAFHMIQYPLGFSFPFSIPPNWIFLNSITSNDAKIITEEEFNIFLIKYKKNIYFSNGIIKNIISLNEMISIFKYLEDKNIGAILSIQNEILNENEIKLLSKNVYLSKYLEQNDILGDKRINIFITNGEYNSVQESIYHIKPMIVLGVELDHYNVASFVKKRKIGEVFQRKNLINNKEIISSIEKVLNKKEYYENIMIISKIMKNLKNPREEFKFWVDFGYKNGFENFQIPSYSCHFSWIIINGYDIAFIWIIIILILILIVKKLINCMHDCLCGKCENKHKKNKHFKFD